MNCLIDKMIAMGRVYDAKINMFIERKNRTNSLVEYNIFHELRESLIPTV